MRGGWRVATLLLLAGAPPCSGANDADGLVLGIAGKWRDLSQKDATKPDAHVHFGSVLKDQKIRCETSGTLTVWFKEAGKPVVIQCEQARTEIAVSQLREENKQNLWTAISDSGSKLFQLITPIISAEPRSYIAAVSRGFGSADLDESVAALRNGQVDLGPALDAAPAGKYSIAFVPLSEDLPDSPPVQVEWQPGRPARVNLAVHAPGNGFGLMKIAIAVPDGTLSATAWILLLPPDRYAAINARFEEARAAVASWPGGTHSQASRAVLRACLRALSQNAAP